MNYSRAIEIIEDLSARGYPSYEKAKALAIKALEKQIPKKPIYSDYEENELEEITPYKATCPVCGYEFEFGYWNEYDNHHCVCGQSIDWSEVDE